jgi:hypothetical protein
MKTLINALNSSSDFRFISTLSPLELLNPKAISNEILSNP